jgi:Flp pilus assembly protein TadD, contains TPR repeats
MKRVLTFSLLVYLSSCATTGEKKPAISPQEARDSMKVWYAIGKDYLVKAEDGRASYEDALRNFRKAFYYSQHLAGERDTILNLLLVDFAYAFLKNNQLDSSEYYYGKLTELDPNDPRGWQGLGFLYGIVRKDYEKSEIFYKKALEVSPDNPEVLFGLAKIYELKGDREMAQKIYEDAIKRDSLNPALNRSYGLFLVEIGDHKGAVYYLERAYKLSENKEDKKILENLVDAYRKAWEKDKSIDLRNSLQYANQLVSLDTSNYTYYVKRASIYENLKMLKEALSDYIKAYSLNPDAKVLLLKQAFIYNDMGNKAEAENVAKTVAMDKEVEGNIRAPAWALIGDIRQERGLGLYKNRKYEDAVSTFDSALAAYEQAQLLGDGNIKEYAGRQIERVKAFRQKAWRKWKKID